MDREKIYRGKRVDNGEWVEGIGILDFLPKGHVYIAKPNKPKTAIAWIEVISETVGDCTGVPDKNSKWIFEGDIVKLQSNHTSYYIVEWHKHQWIFRYINRKTEYYSFDTIDDNFGMKNGTAEKVEVIGNIHDNPELLEATK